jgi:hypothetical protein
MRLGASLFLLLWGVSACNGTKATPHVEIRDVSIQVTPFTSEISRGDEWRVRATVVGRDGGVQSGRWIAYVKCRIPNDTSDQFPLGYEVSPVWLTDGTGTYTAGLLGPKGVSPRVDWEVAGVLPVTPVILTVVK